MIKKALLFFLFLTLLSSVFSVSTKDSVSLNDSALLEGEKILFKPKLPCTETKPTCSPNCSAHKPVITAEFNGSVTVVTVTDFYAKLSPLIPEKDSIIWLYKITENSSTPSLARLQKRVIGGPWAKIVLDSFDYDTATHTLTYYDSDSDAGDYEYRAMNIGAKTLAKCICLDKPTHPLYCSKAGYICEPDSCYTYSDIVGVTIAKVNPIFSLTGTAKNFSGGNFAKTSLANFVLKKYLLEGNEIVASTTDNFLFKNGFFNYAFGNGEKIFPDLQIELGPFSYLLNFVVNGTDTSVAPNLVIEKTASKTFNLVDPDASCNENGCLMAIPFNGRITDNKGNLIVSGKVKNLKVFEITGFGFDSEPVFQDSPETERSFSEGIFSSVIKARLKPNALHELIFDVCDNSDNCDSINFSFFTWKRLW